MWYFFKSRDWIQSLSATYQVSTLDVRSYNLSSTGFPGRRIHSRAAKLPTRGYEDLQPTSREEKRLDPLPTGTHPRTDSQAMYWQSDLEVDILILLTVQKYISPPVSRKVGLLRPGIRTLSNCKPFSGWHPRFSIGDQAPALRHRASLGKDMLCTGPRTIPSMRQGETAPLWIRLLLGAPDSPPFPKRLFVQIVEYYENLHPSMSVAVSSRKDR